MGNVTDADRMLIGGDLVHSESGAFDDSVNPATEEVIGRSPRGTTADIARAVYAAEKAWPAWAALNPGERAGIMRTFAQSVLARGHEILNVEVADTGNTITPMRQDVRIGCDSIDYYAGLAYELKGETIPSTTANLHFTLREPYGTVARIVPFNHPAMFAIGRTAAALVAGNSVVVKPPETSPLSAMILAEIAREVFPPGVFNIVTGTGAVAGDALVRHPAVKRISFIGSDATGRAIQRAAAEVGVKHVSLELGGKNPMIVFPDTDPEEVAQAAVRGMNFAWQGQSCGSTSRLLLHEDIHDAVVSRVVEIVSALRLGDPMDPASQMGPINSSGHYRRILSFVQSGQDEGARLLTGGKRPSGRYFERGYWLEPTVFGGVRPEMRIAREEIFGPVLSVLRWRDFDDAISLANGTEYGLATAIWTNDLDLAFTTAKKVRSGYQWINGVAAHYPAAPFGGMKASGLEREEGVEELLSYTEVKTIHVLLRPNRVV